MAMRAAVSVLSPAGQDCERMSSSMARSFASRDVKVVISQSARPMRRTIQRYVEDPLSEKLLTGEVARGDEVEVDLAAEGDRLTFRALTPSGS